MTTLEVNHIMIFLMKAINTKEKKVLELEQYDAEVDVEGWRVDQSDQIYWS